MMFNLIRSSCQSQTVFTVNPPPGGGGGTKKIFIGGRSAPKSNPLPFYIPFFFRKDTPFVYLLLKKCTPFIYLLTGRSAMSKFRCRIDRREKGLTKLRFLEQNFGSLGKWFSVRTVRCIFTPDFSYLPIFL